VRGEGRTLHNEELNNLYSSPSIVRVVKSRRMRWAGHVADSFVCQSLRTSQEMVQLHEPKHVT
jgi:hypothetical protein